MEPVDPRDLAVRMVALIALLPALAVLIYFGPIWLGFSVTLVWVWSVWNVCKLVIEEMNDAL